MFQNFPFISLFISGKQRENAIFWRDKKIVYVPQLCQSGGGRGVLEVATQEEEDVPEREGWRKQHL